MNVRHVGYAIFSGLLLASLFPPFRFEVIAWVALVPLLWVLQGKRPHEAFALGLLTGLVAYGIIVWWVKISMVTYGGMPLVLAWLVTVLLAGYLALYPALFAYGLARIFPEGGMGVFLLAAPLWVALELVRAYFLTGFPWALLGYSQYRVLPVIQVADLTGVYGISFVIVLVNAAIWYIFRHPGRSPLAVAGGTGVVVVLVLGYGYLRLAEVPREAGPPLRPVGIVQGNTDQGVKWSPTWRRAIMTGLEKQTREVSADLKKRSQPVPPLIVWPEAAAPFIFEDQPAWRARVKRLARESRAYILFGSLSVDRNGKRPRLRNSAFLLGPDGEPVGRYDKMHLVPFGEYVPLSRLLFFVQKIVPIIGTFSEGRKAKVFDALGGKFGVVICFEAIFPRVVRRFRDAQFLVNLTNDAWFGRTAASEQHLSMVALRAVEFRVPIVRAANTGISGFIDARGKILERSPLFERWVRSGAIAPRRTGPTFYARHGDLFALLCLGAVLLALVGTVPRRRARVWYD